MPYEKETDIAVMIYECILLLCQTRGIRETLRKRKVYHICRNYDIEVNQDPVSNVMHEIVQLLMRDESGDQPLDAPQYDAQGHVKLLCN